MSALLPDVAALAEDGRRLTREVLRRIRALEEFGHPRGLKAMARALRQLAPEAYRDPPLALTPSHVLSREGRLALYYNRARAGRRLFHPQDAAVDAAWREGFPASMTD